MKNMKMGFVALCGLVLAFSSCSKDDASPTSNNSFVVDGKSYTTNIATVEEDANANYHESYLILSNLAPGNTANLNAVAMNFSTNSLPTSGSFTYKTYDSGFDSTKNFSDLVLVCNATVDAQGVILAGTSFKDDDYDATGSTITISKSGDIYTFVYNLKFTKNGKTTTASGKYTGKVAKQ